MYGTSIRCPVREIADGNEKSAIASLSLEVFEVGQTDVAGFISIMPFSSPYRRMRSNGVEIWKTIGGLTTRFLAAKAAGMVSRQFYLEEV
jgi:hypothetical protein